ncbi:hypothetical protein EYF80_025455 [Liparis tanakae]|uniref:Uncharacterized protein n=1 Tax=Liparis tanakae TaxID=230148 RepID=A0A4Z2HGG5_9TELE|nr:hypothetical protein EYF80_025455 [Liparis tanakae]
MRTHGVGASSVLRRIPVGAKLFLGGGAVLGRQTSPPAATGNCEDVVVLVLASFSLDTLLALILGVSLLSVGVDERRPRRSAVSADRRGEEAELRVTMHSESLRAEMEPRRVRRG